MLPVKLYNALQHLTPAGSGLLLAISGGCDSMVLLHAVASLRARLSGCDVQVAHFNHALRGAGSERDAVLVQSAASALGMACKTETCEPGELSAAAAGSLEESARDFRYRFLERAALEMSPPTCVVTAHHATDQAETILFHLLRGTGLRGLRGIPPVRELGRGVRVVRPMLELSRDEIRSYAEQHHVPFAEDHTNLDPRIRRNQIRHQLIPLLEQNYNPHAAAALVRLSAQAVEAVECLDELADGVLSQCLLEQTPESCRLKADVLRAVPSVMRRFVLNRLWIRNHWPRQSMSAGHWIRLADLISKGRCGRVDLPGGLTAEVRQGLLRICWSGGPDPASAAEPRQFV